VPLQAFVDGSGPDGAAMTLEAMPMGHPAGGLHRRRGAISEVVLDPEPLHEFRARPTDVPLADGLEGVLP
jgi:hypothetical protein